jgi:hypothetical protein
MIPADRGSPKNKEEMMAPRAAPGRLVLNLGLMTALIVMGNVAADAAPIRYEYGGVITSADPSTGVAPGTRFSGTIAYDPLEKPPAIMIEGSNQYLYGLSASFPGAIADGSGLTLQIGGRTVLADPGGVQVAVAEIEYPGQYGYRDAGDVPVAPYTSVGISNAGIRYDPLQVAVDLRNPDRAVFGSLAPPQALNLADFPQATLDVTELTKPGVKTLYTGTVDSLVGIPAPEPAWVTLVCLTTIGWFARSLRRPRRGGRVSRGSRLLQADPRIQPL